MARREYEAHGLPFHEFSHSVGSLAEALTVIRRLWTETEPFDFAGNPRPAHRCVREPKAGPATAPANPRRRVARPRCCASSRSTPTCGTSPATTSTTPSAAALFLTTTAPRSVATPASLTRSIHLQVSYDRPDVTRDAIGRAIDAGFQHLVLGLPNPYPVGVAQWPSTNSSPPTYRY